MIFSQELWFVFTRAACLTQTIFIDSNDFYTLQYTEQNTTSDILSQANITQTSAALFMFIRDSVRDCTSESLRVALNNPPTFLFSLGSGPGVASSSGAEG